MSIDYVVNQVKIQKKFTRQNDTNKDHKTELNLEKFRDDDVDWDDVKITTKDPKLASPRVAPVPMQERTLKDDESWDDLDFPSSDVLQTKLHKLPGVSKTTTQQPPKTLVLHRQSSANMEDWSDELTLHGKLILNQKKDVASQKTVIEPSNGNELDDL
jgi:hypothetical protein